MPSVARKADLCTGHPGGAPRLNIQGSPNVFVNGRPMVRVGDTWAPHKHAGVSATGSKTVFCNGRAVARVGDLISCKSLVATGSPNVICGD